PWRRPEAGRIDLARRSTVAALLAGAGGAMLLRATPQAQARTYNPQLIRPPGSLAEPDFLARCIQCGICMKACPPNGLHPTAFEAGLEGIWTPMLVARIGYCDYECNLCGQLCPTGAIEPLPLPEKKKVKIGLAVIDRDRCLPYAYARECIVCEEHCPIPTKAITFDQSEVAGRDGKTRLLKLPRVDPDLCTGCGICETKCPFKDLPAIRIVSANETRHPGNQPILQDPGADLYGSGWADRGPRATAARRGGSGSRGDRRRVAPHRNGRGSRGRGSDHRPTPAPPGTDPGVRRGG
ncbi:MAG: 4Fe-4S dicluster domain-containing protein, partial [Candidatus Eisenbacteria bacterium]|nr:4Fe-4S dicluster domain-containing protein [Candidatus Latescibacterota bacterium]MBD3301258.1 4Fe-4S dicluster domain-containing protein [Candidatus Eisenbacteria bacterium]